MAFQVWWNICHSMEKRWKVTMANVYCKIGQWGRVSLFLATRGGTIGAEEALVNVGPWTNWGVPACTESVLRTPLATQGRAGQGAAQWAGTESWVIQRKKRETWLPGNPSRVLQVVDECKVLTAGCRSLLFPGALQAPEPPMPTPPWLLTIHTPQWAVCVLAHLSSWIKPSVLWGWGLCLCGSQHIV